MSARSNLHTALTALESAATSANAVIDQHLAGQVDMMGSGDVQATADRVYNVVASLQSALDKLKG